MHHFCKKTHSKCLSDRERNISLHRLYIYQLFFKKMKYQHQLLLNFVIFMSSSVRTSQFFNISLYGQKYLYYLQNFHHASQFIMYHMVPKCQIWTQWITTAASPSVINCFYLFQDCWKKIVSIMNSFAPECNYEEVYQPQLSGNTTYSA